MTLVFVTFAGIASLVLAIYWVGVVRPESQAQHELRRKLRGTSPVPRRPELTKKTQELSDVPAVNLALVKAGGLSAKLQRLIAQAGLDVTVGTLVLTAGCLFLLAWLLVAYFTAFYRVGLLAGVLAGWLPFAWVRFKGRSRMARFEEQFPETIDLISRALRAGHAFTTGLAMVAEEAPEPIAGEFRVLYDQQNFGMPLPDAMRDFANRIPLIDARFFVTAVLTQRESGGNLAEILDNLAAVIRERFRVKRQVRVITAHARMTGWILVALPPVLAVLFLFTAPETMRILVNDPMGPKMILIAVVLQTIGTLIIRKLVDIRY